MYTFHWAFIYFRYHDQQIPWKRLLNGIFNSSGVEINDNQVLIVSNPGYFKKLHQILHQTTRRTIANYVWTSLLYPWLWLASGTICELERKFEWRPSQPVHSRKYYCFSTAMDYFAVPIMHEYLKTKSNLASRDMLEQTAEIFRSTFDKHLRSNTWLTDATKSAARKKLEALKFFIGYPNWLLNATEIESLFEGLDMRSNSIKTINNVIKKERGNELQYLGKSADDFVEPWFQFEEFVKSMVLYYKYKFTYPSDVAAFYKSTGNFIVISMGMIQQDLFYSKVPSYIIYSRAGFTIGHEILHGFDASRKSLDKDGQKDQSWTVEDELKYTKRSDCYRDQYNKFEVFPGTYLNGSFGLNENIADNEGLKLAFLTYKEQLNARPCGYDHQSLPGFETLSTEQMFFLSYSSTSSPRVLRTLENLRKDVYPGAWWLIKHNYLYLLQMWCDYANEKTWRRLLQKDPHSPGKFRVNGVLQNSPEFAHAWNCPVGAPMNPANKCMLW